MFKTICSNFFYRLKEIFSFHMFWGHIPNLMKYLQNPLVVIVSKAFLYAKCVLITKFMISFYEINLV